MTLDPSLSPVRLQEKSKVKMGKKLMESVKGSSRKLTPSITMTTISPISTATLRTKFLVNYCIATADISSQKPFRSKHNLENHTTTDLGDDSDDDDDYLVIDNEGSFSDERSVSDLQARLTREKDDESVQPIQFQMRRRSKRPRPMDSSDGLPNSKTYDVVVDESTGKRSVQEKKVTQLLQRNMTELSKCRRSTILRQNPSSKSLGANVSTRTLVTGASARTLVTTASTRTLTLGGANTDITTLVEGTRDDGIEPTSAPNIISINYPPLMNTGTRLGITQVSKAAFELSQTHRGPKRERKKKSRLQKDLLIVHGNPDTMQQNLFTGKALHTIPPTLSLYQRKLDDDSEDVNDNSSSSFELDGASSSSDSSTEGKSSFLCNNSYTNFSFASEGTAGPFVPARMQGGLGMGFCDDITVDSDDARKAFGLESPGQGSRAGNSYPPRIIGSLLGVRLGHDMGDDYSDCDSLNNLSFTFNHSMGDLNHFTSEPHEKGSDGDRSPNSVLVDINQIMLENNKTENKATTLSTAVMDRQQNKDIKNTTTTTESKELKGVANSTSGYDNRSRHDQPSVELPKRGVVDVSTFRPNSAVASSSSSVKRRSRHKTAGSGGKSYRSSSSSTSSQQEHRDLPIKDPGGRRHGRDSVVAKMKSRWERSERHFESLTDVDERGESGDDEGYGSKSYISSESSTMEEESFTRQKRRGRREERREENNGGDGSLTLTTPNTDMTAHDKLLNNGDVNSSAAVPDEQRDLHNSNNHNSFGSNNLENSVVTRLRNKFEQRSETRRGSLTDPGGDPAKELSSGVSVTLGKSVDQGEESGAGLVKPVQKDLSTGAPPPPTSPESALKGKQSNLILNQNASTAASAGPDGVASSVKTGDSPGSGGRPALLLEGNIDKSNFQEAPITKLRKSWQQRAESLAQDENVKPSLAADSLSPTRGGDNNKERVKAVSKNPNQPDKEVLGGSGLAAKTLSEKVQMGKNTLAVRDHLQLAEERVKPNSLQDAVVNNSTENSAAGLDGKIVLDKAASDLGDSKKASPSGLLSNQKQSTKSLQSYTSSGSVIPNGSQPVNSTDKNEKNDSRDSVVGRMRNRWEHRSVSPLESRKIERQPDEVQSSNRDEKSVAVPVTNSENENSLSPTTKGSSRFDQRSPSVRDNGKLGLSASVKQEVAPAASKNQTEQRNRSVNFKIGEQQDDSKPKETAVNFNPVFMRMRNRWESRSESRLALLINACEQGDQMTGVGVTQKSATVNAREKEIRVAAPPRQVKSDDAFSHLVSPSRRKERGQWGKKKIDEGALRKPESLSGGVSSNQEGPTTTSNSVQRNVDGAASFVKSHSIPFLGERISLDREGKVGVGNAEDASVVNLKGRAGSGVRDENVTPTVSSTPLSPSVGFDKKKGRLPNFMNGYHRDKQAGGGSLPSPMSPRANKKLSKTGVLSNQQQHAAPHSPKLFTIFGVDPVASERESLSGLSNGKHRIAESQSAQRTGGYCFSPVGSKKVALSGLTANSRKHTAESLSMQLNSYFSGDSVVEKMRSRWENRSERRLEAGESACIQD